MTTESNTHVKLFFKTLEKNVKRLQFFLRIYNFIYHEIHSKFYILGLSGKNRCPNPLILKTVTVFDTSNPENIVPK